MGRRRKVKAEPREQIYRCGCGWEEIDVLPPYPPDERPLKGYDTQGPYIQDVTCSDCLEEMCERVAKERGFG